MHTGNQPALYEYASRNDNPPRLEWLLTANQRATERRQLLRTVREEAEAELIQRPLTAPEAFARFGLLLGAVPPAALLGGFLYYGLLASRELPLWLFPLALVMNLACAFVGYRMGRRAGAYVHKLRDTNWLTALPAYALIGFYWAAITGAAGGLVFFGGGVLFGPFFALPVGIAAFTMFAPLYRLLERGGLIATRQFWPLAWGITLSLAAFILKLYAVILANTQ